MAWQKKYKKRPFPGKRKVSNTSEAVMYHLHIYYITASQFTQSKERRRVTMPVFKNKTQGQYVNVYKDIKKTIH